MRFLSAPAAADVACALCFTRDGAKELDLELAFFSAIMAVPRKHEGVNTRRSAEQKHSALTGACCRKHSLSCRA